MPRKKAFPVFVVSLLYAAIIMGIFFIAHSLLSIMFFGFKTFAFEFLVLWATVAWLTYDPDPNSIWGGPTTVTLRIERDDRKDV
jgi:membrane protein CcdC involved in cytochrome C biogenesis